MDFWNCFGLQCFAWSDSGYTLLRQSQTSSDNFLVYLDVKVDLGPEVDSPRNPDIILRAPCWQLVVRCLSLLPLGDVFENMFTCSVLLARQWIHACVSL